MYERVLSGNKDEQLGMHRVDLSLLREDSRAMLLILQAIVAMHELTPTDGSHPKALVERSKLRILSNQILDLSVLQGITQKQRLSRSAFRSFSIAQRWQNEDLDQERLRP